MRAFLVATAAIWLVACGTSAAGPAADPDFVLGGDSGADVVFGSEDAAPTDTSDVGLTDVQIVDSSSDSSASTDSASLGDAPSSDVPPGAVCPPDSTSCEGDVLLTCSPDGSAFGRTRCSGRGLVCEVGPEGAACVEPTVVPSVCGDPDAEEIGPGEYIFDLCGEGNDANHIEENDCGGGGGATSGGDRFFTFTLETAAEVLIDLRDEDDEGAIDTILYLRTDCLDANSQTACSDDIACGESDVVIGDCNRGVQVRQSRIRTRLDAGSYTIVADHLTYRGFDCGQVRLLLEY